MSFMDTNITWDVYRRFFEESGIKLEVTQILHKIWEEPQKPPYLDHYVRRHFAEGKIDVPNYSLIQQDIVWKKKIVKHMRKRNEKLRSILALYEQLASDRKGDGEGVIDEEDLKGFFAQIHPGDDDSTEERSSKVDSSD